MLKITQNQQHHDLSNLFAIQNPTEDLIYTDLEVETIRSFFPNAEVLAKQAATQEAVKNYQNFSSVHCGHFSCHGGFNPTSPLESALILADEKQWTLGEIFELFLPQCRLVTLSACETGLTDFNSVSDEYIGLPNGFLYAGSPSVVSSLWRVSDVSTAFLMIKFYQNLHQNNKVPIALNQAQLWLRDITKADLQTWIETNKIPLDKLDATKRKDFRRQLFKIQDNARLFQNPYYWAAFCAIGQ